MGTLILKLFSDSGNKDEQMGPTSTSKVE